MADKITIGQSLIITIFSMAVVFLVLIGISYLINLLKVATNNDKKKSKKEVQVSRVESSTKSKEKLGPIVEENVDEVEDEELVAVIAAAVSASMGVSTSEMHIKSIKRVSTPSPAWVQVGRIEGVSNKL